MFVNVLTDKPGCFDSTFDMCKASPYSCSGTGGIITSPHYPSATTTSLGCTWTVSTPENSFIRFRFQTLSLPSTCGESHVKVIEETFDGREVTIVQYCSETDFPTHEIETSLNLARIELQVTSDETGIRMMIEYEAAYFSNRTGNGIYCYLYFAETNTATITRAQS